MLGTKHPFAKRFWQQWLDLHPEEGSTLGYPGCAHRLRRLSPEHRNDEQARLQQLLGACTSVLTSLRAPLARACVARAAAVVRFHLHLHDSQFYARSVEPSLYPYLVVSHQVADLARLPTADEQCQQRWHALAQRLQQLPTVLADQAINFTAGLTTNTATPDRQLLAHVLDDQIPDITGFLATQLASLPPPFGHALPASLQQTLQHACATAAEAYGTHAQVLRNEVLPHCRDQAALGSAEVGWRLREMFQLSQSPAELLARAHEVLATAQRQAVVEANRVGIAATTFAEVAGEFSKRLQDRPLADDQVVAHHRKLLDETLAFLRTHAIFPVPDPCHLEIGTLPPAVVVGTEATNWPAPLFLPTVPAQVRVREVGAMHPRLQWRNLFVHEGIPGHGLQSLAFRELFGGEPGQSLEQLAFLSIHDTVALTFDDYGAMLNIEGYAAHTEERMLEAGFHRGDERMFARVCQAIRACRVIADLGLHTGLLSPPQAIELLTRETAMPEQWARGQVLRYLRCPLQAMTYGVGSWLFAELRAQAQQRGLSDPAFYRRVFACGPLSPAAMEPFLFGDYEPSCTRN